MHFLISKNFIDNLYRIIDLTTKENAIEDCLVAMKKAYEKDVLTLQEFL